MAENNVYRKLLMQKGLRITNVRVKVLEILDGAETPMTVEEVFNLLRNMITSVNLSTVYRTMDVLLKNGLVEKTTLMDFNKSMYEYKRVEHKHHLVCTVCNRMISIEDCPIDEYAREMCNKQGFELTGHKLEIYGICPNCK
ncbi:Fe2+/Zn2+ uptake regulation protein Fur [Thermoclostridium stercorarium subsp. stercorarium DSM 8532]|uniref:Fe2+/Zn2+ uptake regulation protein Fur n=3 Tax=Thermoclostridium stercorarium TaxID=1510 RepID=L7VVF7_THES1|nr:Fur family transcriptional regulator [Thermoclostridium stercorarium]AGC69553.1 Fe2+/Zn2+ uptake regulation protein Fur [Thermoclostridium stercorarium subsp. stercorarium DSM 8532]AGI40505.1 iron-zinc uptake regulator [Thermoclostridium stercorarium subsp. stercorarium DSM 8532]ANW99785.1 Fur family transcriptional regulator [Thermoclostridium stercorarium subsp. thermolacticum DSM 2910]ANX02412.1 Fur family transcriptional regulator [Thermoclostridium stercorarium subsp. leptospartum DSM 9